MERAEVNANTLVIPSPCPSDFAEKWITEATKNSAAGKSFTFAVRERESQRPIGAIFLLLNPAHSHAELGYFFDPISWNKGFASEASREMLRFAFDILKLNRVFATYFRSNPASGRVMEKVGMRHEGCRIQHVRKSETFQDLEQYGLLKTDWLKLKRSEGTP